MNEKEPGDSTPENQEKDRPTPRIYVASLADYNAGRLHGAWIRANQDAEQLHEAIQAMLDDSPENRLCVWCGREAHEHPRYSQDKGAHGMVPGNAEEWAIHDYEGFGPIRLSEYEDMETVAAFGQGIAEHGPAFAAWVSYLGTDQPEQLAKFEEAYRGTWPSVEAYADDLLEDMGAEAELAKLPEWLRPHVSLNVEAYARDLVLGGDLYAVEDGEGTHVFDPNV